MRGPFLLMFQKNSKEMFWYHKYYMYLCNPKRDVSQKLIKA